MPRKLTIGVFGSNKLGGKDIAKALGSAIADGGHIVLTGGSGKRNTERPSELALEGAEDRKGARVGIMRPRKKNKPPKGVVSRKDGLFFRVKTNLGHTRNALEACLCDAAIALEGEQREDGEGTTSEAVFCLALGKPVIFVGDGWARYGFGNGQILTDAMVDTTFKRVTTGDLADHPPLNKLFIEENVRNTLQGIHEFRWFPSPEDVQEEAKHWLDLLNEAVGDTSASFPQIKGYAGIIKAYEGWLQ